MTQFPLFPTIQIPKDGLLSRVLVSKSSASHQTLSLSAPRLPRALCPALLSSGHSISWPPAAPGSQGGGRAPPDRNQTRSPAAGSALPGAHLTPSGGPALEAVIATAATAGPAGAPTAPWPATHCGVPASAPAEAQPRTNMAVGAAPRGQTAAPHKDGRALLRLHAPKLGPAAEFLWAGGAGTSAQRRARGARLVTRLFGTGL